MTTLYRALACLFIATLWAAGPALADELKGRISFISNKASSIQITVDSKPQVVRFDKNTEFVNAASIKDLGPPDLIKVEFTPGQPATKVTKMVFGLPPGVEIGIQELEALMAKGDYTLVDARPEVRYHAGHIPTAISIFAKELPKKLDLLPQDKSKTLVFYCGGPTCPFTGQSVEMVQKEGYTNLKGFQAGMPGWNKAKKPVHSTAAWVAKNLNPQHVIIDVRPADEGAKKHIKTAVSLPAPEFKAMTKKFIAERKAAKLPGVADRSAPIILYGNAEDGSDVLSAYAMLRKWGYKKVSIIEDGFTGWVKNDLPTASGALSQEIAYVKKLKKGAISTEEFAKLQKDGGGATIVDVRSDQETAKGIIAGAVAIPLDSVEASLDRLPKDKEVITYCSNGIRAEMAYELLRNKGYEKVRFLNETVIVAADGGYQID